MENKKLKIGATQINNGFSGQYYLPYSIGLLYAFIKKKFKNDSRRKFRL